VRASFVISVVFVVATYKRAFALAYTPSADGGEHQVSFSLFST